MLWISVSSIHISPHLADTMNVRHPAARQTDRTVQAAISHIANAEQLVGEKPYEIFIETEPGRPQTNMKFAPCDGITIRDARFYGRDNFTLEQSGFEFVERDFNDQLTLDLIKQSSGDAALQSYLTSLGDFLKQHLQANQVVLYDWRVSSSVFAPMLQYRMVYGGR